MALVRCTDCGAQISDLAHTCPVCGRPDPGLSATHFMPYRGALIDKAGAMLHFGAACLWFTVCSHNLLAALFTAFVYVAIGIGVWKSRKSAHFASVALGALVAFIIVSSRGTSTDIAVVLIPGMFCALRVVGLVGPSLFRAKPYGLR